MAGLKLDFTIRCNAQVKRMFFDRDALTRVVEEGNGRALSRQGAIVRRKAKDLIRRRKSPSKPGSPPSSHTGILRRYIYFAYDPRTKSCVVGPIPVNQVTFDVNLSGSPGIVPYILEFGGQAGVVEQAFRNSEGKLIWVRRDLRRYGKNALLAAMKENLKRGHAIDTPGGNFVVPTRHHRFRTYTVEPRPFMGPALVQSKDDLAKTWKDAVR